MRRPSTQQTIEELISTVDFPIVLASEIPTHRIAAAALLSRIIGTTKSSLRIAATGRSTDLVNLIRAMYEHIVMLAWLCSPKGDPTERYEALCDYDDWRSGISDKELLPLIDEVDPDFEIPRSIYSTSPSPKPKGWLNLDERAALVDEEWSKVSGFREAPSLREAYSVIYRIASSMAHPTRKGLATVVERTDDWVLIQEENDGEADQLLEAVIPLVIHSFAVASSAVGRPDRGSVAKIASRYQGPPFPGS